MAELYVISWERGKKVTVVCSVGTSGNYIPLVLIYPGKRMFLQLQKNGPGGALKSGLLTNC
jgi:hypothetical protein